MSCKTEDKLLAELKRDGVISSTLSAAETRDLFAEVFAAKAALVRTLDQLSTAQADAEGLREALRRTYSLLKNNDINGARSVCYDAARAALEGRGEKG